eukprot:gene18119-biopygen9923
MRTGRRCAFDCGGTWPYTFPRHSSAHRARHAWSDPTASCRVGSRGPFCTSSPRGSGGRFVTFLFPKALMMHGALVSAALPTPTPTLSAEESSQSDSDSDSTHFKYDPGRTPTGSDSDPVRTPTGSDSDRVGLQPGRTPTQSAR